MKWKYTFILILLLTASFTFAQILHVPEDFPTIQTAVDAAIENDTILINNGTYVENLQVSKALTIASNYLFSGNQMDIENTIVDGNQNGSVFSVQAIQNDTVRFVGLTVTNGNGTLCDPQNVGLDQLHGGGFYIKDVEAIVFDNMIIHDNHLPTLYNSAGGVFCQNSNLWVRNSKIQDNSVQGLSVLGEGAGLYLYESEGSISNCEITGNTGPGFYCQGGGIYAKNSELEILSTTITNNESRNGGAIYLYDTETEIHNCFINYNLAFVSGGIEVMNFGDNNFQMTNTTVNGNEGTSTIGAIMFYQVDVEIMNCEFNENIGGDNGGALNCTGSNVEIYNTAINNNEAISGSGGNGAGISMNNSIVYLKNVEFNQNFCSPPNSFTQGGAIDIGNSDLVMDSVIMSNNDADEGAAIYCSNSTIRMNHSLIHGHEAQKGGAFYSWGSDIEIISSTISNNSASAGGGFYSRNNQLVFVNSILWDNTPKEIYFHQQGGTNDTTYVDFAWSDVRGHESNFSNIEYGDITWYSGNLDTDPMFVDEPNSDFNLVDDSPLVDAGTSFFELDGLTIIDYNPEEYVGPAPDMGAFENQYINIGLNEIPIANVSVSPNPFNDRISISSNSSTVLAYDIIDNSGKVLIQDHLQPGAQSTINTSHLKQGIYFLRLHSTGQVSANKIIKL